MLDIEERQEETKKRTRADNKKLALTGLTGLAILCILVSGGVLLAGLEDAKGILMITFAPVGVIVPGLLGFIKS